MPDFPAITALPELTPTTLAILFVAGLLAGVLNTIAGAGSFFVFPALLAVGLPPSVMNGTNRVSILFQTAMASWTIHRKRPLDWPYVKSLLPPTLLGSLAGAGFASLIPDAKLGPVFGVILLALCGFMLLNPRVVGEDHPEKAKPRPVVSRWFFLLGLYGGFIQAGIGVMQQVAMGALSGKGLISSAGPKSLLAFFFTVPALAVFALRGQVAWLPGLALAAGSMLGAVIGGHLAVKPEAQKAIMKVSLVALLLSAAQLFGLIPTGRPS